MLEDPEARKSSAPGSAESQGSAVLELLREAGGPALAQTEAFRGAWGRMERAARAESAAFSAAFRALQRAAPDEFLLFLAFFTVAAAEEQATGAEKEAWLAALPEVSGELEEANAAILAAGEEADAGLATIAASSTEAEIWTAVAEVEEAKEALEAARADGVATAVRAGILVVLHQRGLLEEMLSKHAEAVAIQAPTEYADFLVAIEAAESAAPDEYAEFVKMIALFFLAPTEAWR